MPYKTKEDRLEYHHNYYLQNKDKWHKYQSTENVKEYRREYRRKQNERIKKLMANIKHNLGCQECDETNPVCLVFHHVNPEEKKYDVASINNSINLMLEEANKCIVLCHNCHAIIHYGG